MPFTMRTDKWIEADSYNGILLSHEKDYSGSMCRSVGESQKPLSEGEKPEAEECILFDSIHIKS